MRELLIFRHAKSRWDIPGVADHDRDLAPRGTRAAERIGKLVAENDWVPDLVLCSTAVRAQRTLVIAVGAWSWLPDIRSLRSLYLAAPSRLRDVLMRQRSTASRIMLVGHNPGLHGLALALTRPSELRETLKEKLPTAALVRIGFDADVWRDLEPGELLDFVKPRELA